MFDSLAQDFRYATRMLRKNPGFTFVAALMLALGIGANTIVFSVAKAILFRPLGIQESDRVVWLNLRDAQAGKSHDSFSWVDFVDLRNQTKSFSHTALVAWPGVTWEDGDRIENLAALTVTSDVFEVLKTRPVLGRALAASDEQASAEAVAMVSYEFWQNRLGSDPNIVGRALRLDKKLRTIVGVLPPGLKFPVGRVPQVSTGGATSSPAKDVWIPVQMEGADRTERGHRMHPLVARLKPGIELEAAQAELKTLGERWAADFPEVNRGFSLEAISYRDKALGGTRKGIHVLAIAVGAVLVICCVNLANLLLARGVARRRELAVRHALGASRQRMLRTLLAESALLSIAGGAIGILLAIVAVPLIRAYGPAGMPFVNEIIVDATVIVVTIGICLATTLLFGLMPAVWQSRIHAADSLKAGARSTATLEIRSLQRGLLVGQIALALALVASAALLLESFRRLVNVELGYKPQQVITMDLGGWNIPTNEDNVRMYREIKREVAAIPGVEAVGTIQSIPLTAKWTWDERVQILGEPRPALEQPLMAITFVAFDYFGAMQIPLIAGRVFREEELRDDGYGQYIIINETAAKTLFGLRNAIGKSISIGSTHGRFYEIIGVVRDTRDVKLEQSPAPRFYLHYTHGGTQLLVRTSATAPAIVPMLRSALKKFGANVIISNVKPMSEIISDTIAERRFMMGMLTSYAALAVAIAAVGIFGVSAFQVAQRTNEFGVRLALGATPRGVMAQVLGESARWTVSGLFVGILLAFAAARLLASQLYDLSPHDPVIFIGVTLFLLAIGLLASLFPARRAASVDPLTALRCD